MRLAQRLAPVLAACAAVASFALAAVAAARWTDLLVVTGLVCVALVLPLMASSFGLC